MDQHGHLAEEERVAYWARTLPPPALLAMSDHLQTCAWCREQILQSRPAAEAAEPVAYEDLLAWLDDDLDPIARREIAGRLAASAPAAADLAEFRDEMNSLPPRNYALDEEENPRSRSWLWPIAAGLALGCAFLWWSSAERGATVGITLRDAGQQIIVRQNGAVTEFGSLPEDLRKALRQASLGQFHLPAAVTSLQSENGTLAGAPAPGSGFTVIAPVGTLVEATRPTFHWKAEPEANGYRINIAPRRGGEIVTSPMLDAAQREWTPNEPLQPNETYEWDVEALRDGEMIAKAPAPPAPEARFAIVPEEKRRELEARREKYGRSHLLMGVAYAEAGLLPEARAEFGELAKENPQSDLPKKLLAGLTKP